jgi:hypothetical protein
LLVQRDHPRAEVGVSGRGGFVVESVEDALVVSGPVAGDGRGVVPSGRDLVEGTASGGAERGGSGGSPLPLQPSTQALLFLTVRGALGWALAGEVADLLVEGGEVEGGLFPLLSPVGRFPPGEGLVEELDAVQAEAAGVVLSALLGDPCAE